MRGGFIKMNFYYEYETIYDDVSAVLEAFYDIDIVTEADEINQNENTQVNFINVLKSKIEKIVNYILNMLDDIIRSIYISANKFMTTNKGFLKEYKRFARDYKPKEKIAIINYSYNLQFLTQLRNKIYSETIMICNKYKSSGNAKERIMASDNILNMDDSKFIKEWIRMTGGEGETYADFSTWVKTNFRSDKKQVTISINQISNYVNAISKYGNIIKSSNTSITTVQNQIKSSKNYITSVLSRPDIENDIKKSLTSQIGKLTKLTSLYANFEKLYVSLMQEYVINSRIIIKRFYTM